MNVPPSTYLRLFDLLCQEIAKLAYPDLEKAASLKQIANAVIKFDNRTVSVSEDILLSPFKYFIDLRTQAKKGNIVTIHDLRLVKVIEFIERVPEKNQYSGYEWENAAQQMLSKFEENYCPKPPKEKLPYEYVENLFLDVVLKYKDVFEAKRVTSLVRQFFEALNEKKYLDAWDLLSPDIRKVSIWDGDFYNFQLYHSFLNSVTVRNVTSFSYEFQKITCEIWWNANGFVFNSKAIFSTLKTSKIFRDGKYFNILRMLLSGIKQLNSFKERMNAKGYKFFFPLPEKSISDLPISEIQNIFIQQCFFISLRENNSDKYQSYFYWYQKHLFEERERDFEDEEGEDVVKVKKYYSFTTRITIKYANDRFLIDEMDTRLQ